MRGVFEILWTSAAMIILIIFIVMFFFPLIFESAEFIKFESKKALHKIPYSYEEYKTQCTKGILPLEEYSDFYTSNSAFGGDEIIKKDSINIVSKRGKYYCIN